MSDPASLPPGFRFHPTDEELILHYLRNQAAFLPCPVSIIAEVDIYKFDPWDLPAKALFGEQEWYFFSPRDRKYPNGVRPNRAAGSGYWKATGTDKPIHGSRGREDRPVGVKKALVFYRGRPPKGRKTNWIMHEYRLAEPRTANTYKPLKFSDASMRLDDWVLCRIYKKHGHDVVQPLPPPLVDREQEDVVPRNHGNSGGGGGGGGYKKGLRLQKSFSVSDFLEGYSTCSAVPSHGLFDNIAEMNGSELGMLNLNHLLADGNCMSLMQQKFTNLEEQEYSTNAFLSAKRQLNYLEDNLNSSSAECNLLSRQRLLNSHLGLH